MKWYSYSCSKRLGPVEYEYEYENTGIPVIMIGIVGRPKAVGRAAQFDIFTALSCQLFCQVLKNKFA
jgi:hypothetical protein